VLCPVPAGTANELCRALGHLAVAGSAFDAAASPRTQAIDLMRVRCMASTAGRSTASAN
jgi:diacylglycerol kinase (ATP)